MLFPTYDENDHHLMRENVQAVDYGLDFYAMQTYDGRRVMIGWMQNWKTVGSHLPKQGFMGQMSIVRELESCRRNKIAYRDVMMTDKTSLQGISGRFIDVTVTIRPGNEASAYRWFKIFLAQD